MKICTNGHGEKDGKFCNECGSELQEVEKKEGQSFSMSGKKPCPGCGFELDHGHQKYCPGCGHQLTWTCR